MLSRYHVIVLCCTGPAWTHRGRRRVTLQILPATSVVTHLLLDICGSLLSHALAPRLVQLSFPLRTASTTEHDAGDVSQ